MRTVICDYCGRPARLINSSMVYNGQDYGMIYYCHECEAWVGVHKGTDEPLGRLAQRTDPHRHVRCGTMQTGNQNL